MIVSTIILTKDNFYVNSEGKLPARPDFDKELLSNIVTGQRVSDKAYEMLPRSMKKVVKFSMGMEPTVGITIKEIDGLTDLLIVVHSNEIITRGKQFRMDNFKLLVKDRKVSIYKRK